MTTKYIQFPGVLFTLEGPRPRRVTLTTAEHGTLALTRLQAAQMLRRFRLILRETAERRWQQAMARQGQ